MTPQDHGSGESRPPQWWATLPGILTAATATITALGGLIVAINQMRGPTSSADTSPKPDDAATGIHSTPSPGASDATRPANTGSALPVDRAAESPLPESAPAAAVEGRLQGGDSVIGVRSARIEPFNQQTRVVRLLLRFANNGTSFDRTYYTLVRLMADGVPQAPENAPLEQVEAQSVKDVAYTFRVPAETRAFVLRLTRMEQVVDLPLDPQQ